MNINKNVKPCEQGLGLNLLSHPAYAVALSSLTHGLRRARFDQGIAHELGKEDLESAHKFRDETYSIPSPHIPFFLPAYAAKVMKAGIEGEYITPAPQLHPKVRALSHKIGAELVAAYEELSAQTMPVENIVLK
ncbi:MAG: hypothetical protein ABIR37_01960 [Candidatus Saccharimonadales bacterium]